MNRCIGKTLLGLADIKVHPPRARLAVFRLEQSLEGHCAVCGEFGQHEFFDCDLHDLVGAECVAELKQAEIHALAYIAPFP